LDFLALEMPVEFLSGEAHLEEENGPRHLLDDVPDEGLWDGRADVGVAVHLHQVVQRASVVPLEVEREDVVAQVLVV
jgi:hypothetical protein